MTGRVEYAFNAADDAMARVLGVPEGLVSLASWLAVPLSVVIDARGIPGTLASMIEQRKQELAAETSGKDASSFLDWTEASAIMRRRAVSP